MVFLIKDVTANQIEAYLTTWKQKSQRTTLQ